MSATMLFRSVGAVVLGLALALGLAVAVEGFSAIVHPFPEDFDFQSFEAMVAHVERYPSWVLAICGLMWVAAVLASTWLATRVGSNRHAAHGIVVGVVLLAAVLFNMAFLPYPLWFEISMVVLFPLATFIGVQLGRE